jgi:hypothetical protein
MCSLCGFTKMNRKHADMEVIKSNDFFERRDPVVLTRTH